MAKRGRKKKKDVKVGIQLALIDVEPENIKGISKHLQIYKAAQARRLAALKIECDEKKIILDLVHQADLQRLPDGVIRFACEGLTVEVTPTDEVIKIKGKSDQAGEKSGKKSMAETVEKTE